MNKTRYLFDLIVDNMMVKLIVLGSQEFYKRDEQLKNDIDMESFNIIIKDITSCSRGVNGS